MNRNEFGKWGIELDDDEFAQVIAVLGLPIFRFFLSSSTDYLKENINLIKWIPSEFDYNKRLLLENQNSILPREVMDFWQKFIERNEELFSKRSETFAQSQIRIEIAERYDYPTFQGEFDLFWIVAQLSRPKVRADSVFVEIPENTSKIIWDYPLRIGLLNDTKSRQLREELEVLRFGQQSLLNTHIKLIDVSRSGQNCDLLVLPHSLRDSLSALLQSPNALQAGCVLVLGKMEDSRERAMPIIETLRTQARAEGIALVHVLPEKVENEGLNLRQIWFKELVRQFSHNQPIDVALFLASRDDRVGIKTPLLFANRYLVESSHLTRRISQYKERLAQPNWKKHKIDVSREGQKIIAYNTRSWKDDYTVGEVIEGLGAEAENFRFDAEKETATAFSELKTDVETGLKNAPPLKPKSRWIQTEVWELNDQEKTAENRLDAIKQGFLRINKLYEVAVFIGAPSENSISAVKEFPEENLPPNINKHDLTVIFTESQLSPEPQMAQIILPREGNSTVCSFYFRVSENITQISARIIIAYKNRILQTALLEARVVSAESEKIPEQRIELLIESVVCPGLENLTNRKWFDAALVVNHGIANKPEMTRLTNDDAELIGIAGIEETIGWFRDEITNVAHKQEKFGRLDSKESVKLLRNCALNGAALYDAMMTGRDEGALAKAQRIQLITAKLGDDFPLEFVYGRTAPNLDAPLCPQAKEALLNGHCDVKCPVGTEAQEVICPLGFWGLNRVIERHAYDARALQELGRADFALQSNPVEGRDYLNVFESVLVAASNNVDPKKEGTLDKVIGEIKNVSGIDTTPVKSWKDWTTRVKDGSPSLIVLLPHTFEDAGTKQQWMEIDAAEKLLMQHLKREYLVGPNDVPRPLVILMGCQTANAEVPYQKLIIRFKNEGAALVLGTGSTVFGPHAAAVTEKLISALAAVKTEDTAFGDILLDVRRRLLAEGLLIVMCLTSYGDTDWVISPLKEKTDV